MRLSRKTSSLILQLKRPKCYRRSDPRVRPPFTFHASAPAPLRSSRTPSPSRTVPTPIPHLDLPPSSTLLLPYTDPIRRPLDHPTWRLLRPRRCSVLAAEVARARRFRCTSEPSPSPTPGAVVVTTTSSSLSPEAVWIKGRGNTPEPYTGRRRRIQDRSRRRLQL
jgi:hypothetical protein